MPDVPPPEEVPSLEEKFKEYLRYFYCMNVFYDYSSFDHVCIYSHLSNLRCAIVTESYRFHEFLRSSLFVYPLIVSKPIIASGQGGD